MDSASFVKLRRDLDRRVREELRALRSSGCSEADRLEEACGKALDACADGLPSRHMRACAEVSDAGRLRLPGRDVQLRTGPYPLHLRGFECTPIDDFTCTEDALLVGAKGAVSVRGGTLLVVEARGRHSVSDQFHIVRPAAADYDYLRHVLRALDAGRLAKGTNAARVIELADLRGAAVPWPAHDARCRFSDAMDMCEQEGAGQLHDLLAAAWMLSARDASRLEHVEPVPVRAMPPEERDRPREDRGCDALSVAEGVLAVLDAGTPPLDVTAQTSDLANAAHAGRSALCVCFPPPNQGIWTDCAVDGNDPRWTFGPPPRNKANFAWIQQTVACMEDGGCALMLLCNAALHSSIGREADLRRAWARSGLVETVIALPGGLFSDGRPPSSLVVMRKGRAGESTLFVNALELGSDLGPSPSGAMARCLAPQAVERIVGAFAAWKGADGYRDVPGFCRDVPADEIEAQGSVLAPWTYVGGR